MRSEPIRPRGYASPSRRRRDEAANPIPQPNTNHFQSGIVMFSRRQKVLHVNRRVLEIAGYLNHAESRTARKIYAGPVRELWTAMQTALDQRRAANIWEPFELKHVLFEEHRRILLRGIGLADRSSHDDSRVVIILEELAFDRSVQCA